MIMKISRIIARQIFDSRGAPTVEADVWAGNVLGRAAAPAGKSTGIHEAVELRDNGEAFWGAGVSHAVRNINEAIGPALIGHEVTAQAALDRLMRELDATPNKAKLGANAILAVSLAIARAAALTEEQPLWQYLKNLTGFTLVPPRPPRLIFNVINGGRHAATNLMFQEYHIIPHHRNIAKAMRVGAEVYHALGDALAERCGFAARNVGDEGGYAPALSHSFEPFEIMWQVVKQLGYQEDVDLGLDAAATGFYDAGLYRLDQAPLTRELLLAKYQKLAARYPLALIEDPFAEQDLAGFQAIRAAFNVKSIIAGDDLTVSDASRIERSAQVGAINAVIIKVNQVGTLTEALEAVAAAKANQCEVIVSHRSGETEDTFISHLAYGLNAWGIKAGAPARGERTAKYNELLRIEESIDTDYNEWKI